MLDIFKLWHRAFMSINSKMDVQSVVGKKLLQFTRKEGWSLLCICACLFNFLRSSLIGSCELYLHIHFTVQNKRLLWFNLVCTFKRRIPCWLKQSQGAIKVTWVSVHPSSDCLSILVRPKFLRLWLFNAVQSGYLALAKTLDQPK